METVSRTNKVVGKDSKSSNLLCHLMSIQDTLSINPAKIVMGRTKSILPKTVCMTF